MSARQHHGCPKNVFIGAGIVLFFLAIALLIFGFPPWAPTPTETPSVAADVKTATAQADATILAGATATADADIDTSTATSTPSPRSTRTPTATPPPVLYTVRVREKGTGNCIKEARVILEVRGKFPLDDVTSEDGIAMISVSHDYIAKQGNLIVEADGYKRYERYVNLTVDALPNRVLLEPVATPVPPTKTPTPVVPTATPKPTATFAPTPVPPTFTPTSTPTPLPIPTQVLIKLLEPPLDAEINVNQVYFKWEWLGGAPLAADENFALRMWREDSLPEERHSIAWTDQKPEYILTLDKPPVDIKFSPGFYYWNVAWVRELCGDHHNPDCWEALYESEPRRLYIKQEALEPTPPPPPPTPTPAPPTREPPTREPSTPPPHD
jgi:hypothetical protein